MFDFSLRNIKPEAATMKEWREWKQRAMRDEPFRYWLNETVPNFFKDLYTSATEPLNDLRYAIRCRVFDKYHVIDTGLKPGYADCDTRILHGMFNLLVDYVEVEKAWMHVVFDKGELAKRKHPWWSHGWSRVKAFRDPEAGLAHIAWEMTLDNPDLTEYERSDRQAANAREELALYNWWKNDRPNRADPYEASGWTEYCDKKRSNGNDIFDLLDEDTTPEEKLESKTALDKLRQIEQAYDDEDTEMLIRLVKIRQGMWT